MKLIDLIEKISLKGDNLRRTNYSPIRNYSQNDCDNSDCSSDNCDCYNGDCYCTDCNEGADPD